MNHYVIHFFVEVEPGGSLDDSLIDEASNAVERHLLADMNVRSVETAGVELVDEAEQLDALELDPETL